MLVSLVEVIPPSHKASADKLSMNGRLGAFHDGKLPRFCVSAIIIVAFFIPRVDARGDGKAF